jgi:tetratricopeptide (TPR) repeat protein
LRLRVDAVAWWEEHAELTNAQRFTDYMREVILAKITAPVVVFVDEIDATLNLAWRDEFFAAVRALYNARADDVEYERLTFVLLGVASPPDLIRDTALTPFNIGHGIVLQEFDQADAALLLEGLESVYPDQGKTILDRILHWTNGHPYLTQRLCLAAVQSQDGHWTAERVDALVQELFLSDEARKETNLQFVQSKILTHSDRRRLLALYAKVADGRTVTDDVQSPIQSQLKLSGIVKADHGRLCIRNEIYRRVFDPDWVRENMPINWTLWIAIVSTVLLVILALGLGYWWSRRGQQTAEAQAQAAIQNIQQVPSADVRITGFADLFQLEGYQDRARALFFGELPADEQMAMFEQADPQAVGTRLIIVTHGLYVYPGLRNDAQGNALLDAMVLPLGELVGADAVNLAAEIEQWRRGRDLAAGGQYEQAIIAYDAAIRLNGLNPGTLYDRGVAYAELGKTDAAMADLLRVPDLGEGWEPRVASALVTYDHLFSAFGPLRGAHPELAGLVPTPTSTPTPTDTPTSTPTPVPPKSTATLAPTPTQPTSTPVPPTNTPLPPTATNTPLPPTPTPTPVPPTPTPTNTFTPTPSPPVLVAPAQGSTQKNPVTFEWAGSLRPGQAYRVVARHPATGHRIESDLLTDTSWVVDLPAERVGDWRWQVFVAGLARSSEGQFWFDPTPGLRPKPTNTPPQ